LEDFLDFCLGKSMGRETLAEEILTQLRTLPGRDQDKIMVAHGDPVSGSGGEQVFHLVPQLFLTGFDSGGFFAEAEEFSGDFLGRHGGEKVKSEKLKVAATDPEERPGFQTCDLKGEKG
jgi:hypothetical protein